MGLPWSNDDMSFVHSISPDYDHLFTLLNPLLNTFQVIPLSVLTSFSFFLLLQTQRLNILIRQSFFILILILNLALKPQSDNYTRAPRIPTITLKLQKFMPMFIPTPRINNLGPQPKEMGRLVLYFMRIQPLRFGITLHQPNYLIQHQLRESIRCRLVYALDFAGPVPMSKRSIGGTFSLRKPCDSFPGLLVGRLRASYFDRAVYISSAPCGGLVFP